MGYIILVSMIIFICMFAFTVSLMAYDDLLTDWAGLNTARSLGIQGNIIYGTASKSFDKDGEKFDADATNIRIPIFAQYGISDKLNVNATVPIVSTKNGDTESGIGDIWLGLKYSVLGDELLNARVSVQLPSGDDDKGLGNPGGVGVNVGVHAFKPINESIILTGQAGLRFAGEDSDTKWAPGMMIYVFPVVGYRVNETITVGAGVEAVMAGDGQMDGTDMDDTGINWIEPWIYGIYTLPNGMECMCSIGNVVSGKNASNNLDVYFRLNRNFDF
jgi:hypothetical protein